MTDTITPASLRAHADWIDGCGHGLGPGEALRAEAARLEAEAARDEEVETLAKVMSAAMDPGSEWSLWPAGVVERWKTAARAVLDQLAADGRLLPEGGTATDFYPHQSGDFTDLGPGIFTDNSGDVICWKGENYVRQAPPAVSVPDSGPDGTPEKPWPTWQEVPEGVRYTDQADPNAVDGWWVNRGGQRFSVNRRDGHEFASALSESKMQRLAPFVRVDGDKA